MYRVALFVLALVSSCAHDVADRYYGAPYQPCSPEAVVVLHQRPARPFHVIADFQARNATIDMMREKAARIGADAIIVAKVGGFYNPDDHRPDVDSYRDLNTDVGHLVATAIKYKEK